MLNTISGASTLPRQLIQWLDGLDLSYAVRNPKMDLANGFIIAQILTRKFPSQLSILSFYNAQRKDRKIDNWQQIQKFLSKKKFKITKQQFESIANLGPQTAQALLFRLYQFLTGFKLNVDRRLGSTLPPPEEPLYKKPTASYAVKDRQLDRIVDKNQKELKVKATINNQKSMYHTQKYNTGLIQWLIDKRKQQIQKQVTKQREQIQRKTKTFVNSDSKVQVREIQLKCFNSSTSKKAKGQFGELSENKGVLDFLAQSCVLLLKKQSVTNDLKKFGIQIKDKQSTSANVLIEIFNRCDQQDSKGNLKITSDTISKLIQLFKKTSQVNLIVDNINNNFVDCKKFFSLFYKPLLLYEKDSQIFKSILNLFSLIAKGLLKIDAQSTQMMFQQAILPSLLQISQNEFKRPLIANLLLQFVRKQSQCYHSLILKIKQLVNNNIRKYISLLAHLLERIARDCDDIQYTLWSEFFYYGFLGLNNPAPVIRAHGAKILGRLFSDVVVANNQVVGQKLNALKGLAQDQWWQVRAQALIIFKAILLGRYKNQNSSDINDDLNTKTILHYITQIFKPDVSHNILRIGLIQLSQLLVYQESLCQRYLEILLHVGPQIRSDVLNSSIIKFGPVVYGANTFVYKLTGACLGWNSLGIARVLAQYLKKNKITQLTRPHLQILYAAISKNGNFIQIYPQWLRLYQQFKQKLFKTLLDEDLCELGLCVIKQFFQTQQIHIDLINASRGQFSRLLSSVYIDSSEGQVKSNVLQLFKYLNKDQSQYTYKIIKDFAERQKTKYLCSNLIDFMNNLTRQRRKKLFNQ